MNNLPAGAEHDPNAPFNETTENYCRVCDTPISESKIYCCEDCFKSDQL